MESYVAEKTSLVVAIYFIDVMLLLIAPAYNALASPNADPFALFFVLLFLSVGFLFFAAFIADVLKILVTEYLYKDPPIPFRYVFGTACCSLLITIAATSISITFSFPIYLWLVVWIMWGITVVMPFAYYPFYADKKLGLTLRNIKDGEFKRGAIADREVLDVVKKYAGIVTPSVLVYELNISLDEATKILKKFCKSHEAIKKKIGHITLFDFPSARIYLTKLENQIIELLRDNPHGLTRSILLSLTKLSIDALDDILKRLESRGIIHYDDENDTYMLRGLRLTASF